MLHLLATLALAEPPAGYVEVKRVHDCVLYKGPAEDDGVAPMRAECRWKDVDPDALIALLTDYEAYDDLIFGIDAARVVRVEGGRALVHQVQSTRGIATREVLLWMDTRRDGDAAVVSWVQASDEPLEVAPGHVRAPRNEGAWEVRPDPEGGARVVHRIAYDPGGDVPAWLVRWFQVGGMAQVMGDVRARARAASAGGE